MTRSPPPYADWPPQPSRSAHPDGAEETGYPDPSPRFPTGRRRRRPHRRSWPQPPPSLGQHLSRTEHSQPEFSPESTSEAPLETKTLPPAGAAVLPKARSRFHPEDQPAPNPRRRSFP